MTSTVGELERRLALLTQIEALEARTCQVDLDLLYERWRLLSSIGDMEDSATDWSDIGALRERVELMGKIAHAEKRAA
jgi:hypothetical protein